MRQDARGWIDKVPHVDHSLSNWLGERVGKRVPTLAWLKKAGYADAPAEEKDTGMRL